MQSVTSLFPNFTKSNKRFTTAPNREIPLYANVKTLDECPDWFLELAQKYNLPILIMQNKEPE